MLNVQVVATPAVTDRLPSINPGWDDLEPSDEIAPKDEAEVEIDDAAREIPLEMCSHAESAAIVSSSQWCDVADLDRVVELRRDRLAPLPDL